MHWLDNPHWVLYLPPRLKETYHWWSALWAFDSGDIEPIVELISKEDIPKEYKQDIADIVSGKRKPNLKSKIKSKIPPKEKGECILMIGTLESFKSGMNNDAIYGSEHQLAIGIKEPITGVVGRATYGNLEAREYRKRNTELFNGIRDRAFFKEYGIKDEALKKFTMEGKQRLRKWQFD